MQPCGNVCLVEIHFLGQPFSQQLSLLDFVEHATTKNFDEIKIAVAWAKRSGLGRIWEALDGFRANGGRIVLVLGVSEGGATTEGLELALQAADEAYVFHDPRRTFHPKVYLASSFGPRSLLVGSSNLTAGGLGWNYESSLWVDWDAGEGTDVTDAVDEWFDTLIAVSGTCQPLTAALIAQLQSSKDIFIGSESQSRRVRRGKSDAPEDTDSVVAATVSGLFAPILAGLRKLPGLSSKVAPLGNGASGGASGASRKPLATGIPASAPIQGTDPALPLGSVRRRWFKELDHTAAQQPKGARTNPTGNLRLSRENSPINHTVYFRNDFFGGLPWVPTAGKNSEVEVVVAFRAWIDGHDLGMHNLRLSHDPNRISGQNNVPTVLHWGTLAPIMRATDYIGYYVNLERIIAGGYNLVVSKTPRGDYLP